MRKYIKPSMECVRFECEDIMSLSGVTQVTTKTEADSTSVQVVNVADTTTTAAASPFDPLS